MASLNFAKALTLGCALVVALPLGCGDDDDDSSPLKPTPGEAGAGGEGPNGRGGDGSGVDMAGAGGAASLPPGLSLTPTTVECSASCESTKVSALGQTVYVDPCCAADNACGTDTSFLALEGGGFAETCQPRNQPGAADPDCPATDPIPVPVGATTAALDPFQGCCRPNGTCGVLVNRATFGGGLISLGDFALGCVDAAPFFPGEAAQPCGAGGAGAGGAGGATSSGGAPSSGGAGGSP